MKENFKMERLQNALLKKCLKIQFIKGVKTKEVKVWNIANQRYAKMINHQEISWNKI